MTSLATLVERSLIQRLPDTLGGARYQVHELVRSYASSAWRRLAGGRQRAPPTPGLLRAALRCVRGVVEHSRRAGLAQPLAAEAANFDAAMLWALDQDDPERALRVMFAMFAFWLYSSTSFAIRRDRLSRALTVP